MKKKEEQGLQKLTVSELLKSKEIQKEDYGKLSKDEQTELFNLFREKMNTKGVKKDEVIKTMWNLLDINARNTLWEHNHETILLEIHSHIMDHGRMPTIRNLVDKTDLSRQTITKHLNEYKENQLYKDYKEQYKMLHTKVLDVVYKISMRGDIKACKLYLETTGEMIKANTYIDKQQNNSTLNNYAQLTPEEIKKLADKLKQDY